MTQLVKHKNEVQEYLNISSNIYKIITVFLFMSNSF